MFVPPEAGGGFALDAGQQPPQDVEPTLVGATEQEVPIGRDRAEVTIGVEPAGGLGLDEEGPKHVYVVLQNVKATTTRDRTYAVHVGVPEGEDPAAHPELLAGRFSTFGVVGATSPDRCRAHRELRRDPIVRRLDPQRGARPARPAGHGHARRYRRGRRGALGLDETSDLRIGQIGVFFG